MNTKIVAIVVAVVILIGGAFAFIGLSNSAMRDYASNSAPGLSQSGVPPADDSGAETGTGAPGGTGVYTDYSPAAVSAANGTTVLFFHAPWCPQCVALDRDITANGAPDGWTILKADYDSSTELKRKYGVTLQTTVVFIDSDGELIAKEIVYDEPTLASLVAAAP